MKKILLTLLFCLPWVVFAQSDEKYLEGTVTMKDGKVSFSTEMHTPSLTKDQIYETLLEWSNKRFQPDEKMKARVLYTNQKEGSIANYGEEYIVFSSAALSLDRTRIYYQLIISCENDKCKLEMNRIRYWYDEARDGGEKFTAEEWITDQNALNKSKTKLLPISGKFRRKTIDLKDELFKEIQTVLGQKMIELGVKEAPVTPESKVTVVQTEAIAATPAPPTTVVAEASQPEDVIAQATRMTITGDNDEQFEISKESWGGFGELFGKKVAFCLIDTQKTLGNMLMSQSENYKISFYTSNNNQAALVVECKKLTQQNVKGEEAKKMNPNCAIEKSYNLYVGEVLK